MIDGKEPKDTDLVVSDASQAMNSTKRAKEFTGHVHASGGAGLTAEGSSTEMRNFIRSLILGPSIHTLEYELMRFDFNCCK